MKNRPAVPAVPRRRASPPVIRSGNRRSRGNASVHDSQGVRGPECHHDVHPPDRSPVLSRLSPSCTLFWLTACASGAAKTSASDRIPVYPSSKRRELGTWPSKRSRLVFPGHCRSPRTSHLRRTDLAGWSFGFTILHPHKAAVRSGSPATPSDHLSDYHGVVPSLPLPLSRRWG